MHPGKSEVYNYRKKVRDDRELQRLCLKQAKKDVLKTISMLEPPQKRRRLIDKRKSELLSLRTINDKIKHDTL